MSISETVDRELGFRKWRITRGFEIFYVVICKPWSDAAFHWYISPNGARWVEITRDELRRYLDKK